MFVFKKLYSMLEMMINSTSGIRLQDVNTFFTNIAANPGSVDILYIISFFFC